MDRKKENDAIKATIKADSIGGQVAVGNNITQKQSPSDPQQETDITEKDTTPETSRAELMSLRQILSTLFNEGELRDLCFDLNVDYENLAGAGKADKARELVAYFQRRGNLTPLLAACQQLRPHAFE